MADFTHDAPPVRRSRWIPWCFVAFFGVIFIANGIMLTAALSTFNGLETTGSYDRGIAYNEELARLEAQRALGWDVAMAFEATPGTVTEGTLRLRLIDPYGLPLSGAQITGEVRRPTHDDQDVPLQFRYAGDGLYLAEVTLADVGQWESRLTIDHERGSYRAIDRFFLSR